MCACVVRVTKKTSSPRQGWSKSSVSAKSTKVLVNNVLRKAIDDTLIRCYDENEDLFAEALAKDLRKPRQEAVMLEVTYFKPLFQRIVFRLNS